MNTSEARIIDSMKSVLDSHIDLHEFIDEFSFYYLYLPYDEFRDECSDLFDACESYRKKNYSEDIPLEGAIAGASLINKITETYILLSDKPIGLLN